MNIKREIIKSQRDLIKLNNDNKEIIVKAKFGPSKRTRIPLILEEKLAFFVATIIGDGHLKKSKYQINIELVNRNLLENIQKICKSLFKREFSIKSITARKNKQLSHRLGIDSKAVFSLLNLVFLIPRGKKSDIVCVPKVIKDSTKSIKSAFLLGIMATEGGKRRRDFGLSTSSKKLCDGLCKLFKEIGIEIKKDEWIYKKYNKKYYGLLFKKRDLSNLIKNCDSQEIKKIFGVCDNFK